MLVLQGSELKVENVDTSVNWTDIIRIKRDRPLLKYNPQAFIDKCSTGLNLFRSLPLYTLCDGAGGEPLGLMTEAKYQKISESDNHKDIASFLYIAHPFLAHYCDIGSRLLSILYSSGYSHSETPDDFNLFHYLCGSRNTFTQVHNHATATALLLDGLKEWWLAPPTVTSAKNLQTLFLDRVSFLYQNPSGSLCEWMEMNRNALIEVNDLSIIMQPAGSSLYIPDKWYHGVLNHSYSRSITLSWDYSKGSTDGTE